jgi:hypothetical protein
MENSIIRSTCRSPRQIAAARIAFVSFACIFLAALGAIIAIKLRESKLRSILSETGQIAVIRGHPQPGRSRTKIAFLTARDGRLVRLITGIRSISPVHPPSSPDATFMMMPHDLAVHGRLIELDYYFKTGRLGMGDEWCSVPEEIRKWLLELDKRVKPQLSHTILAGRNIEISMPDPNDYPITMSDWLRDRIYLIISRGSPGSRQPGPGIADLSRDSGRPFDLFSSVSQIARGTPPTSADATVMVSSASGHHILLGYNLATGHLSSYIEWCTVPNELRKWILEANRRAR